MSKQYPSGLDTVLEMSNKEFFAWLPKIRSTPLAEWFLPTSLPVVRPRSRVRRCRYGKRQGWRDLSVDMPVENRNGLLPAFPRWRVTAEDEKRRSHGIAFRQGIQPGAWVRQREEWLSAPKEDR